MKTKLKLLSSVYLLLVGSTALAALPEKNLEVLFHNTDSSACVRVAQPADGLSAPASNFTIEIHNKANYPVRIATITINGNDTNTTPTTGRTDITSQDGTAAALQVCNHQQVAPNGSCFIPMVYAPNANTANFPTTFTVQAVSTQASGLIPTQNTLNLAAGGANQTLSFNVALSSIPLNPNTPATYYYLESYAKIMSDLNANYMFRALYHADSATAMNPLTLNYTIKNSAATAQTIYSRCMYQQPSKDAQLLPSDINYYGPTSDDQYFGNFNAQPRLIQNIVNNGECDGKTLQPGDTCQGTLTLTPAVTGFNYYRADLPLVSPAIFNIELDTAMLNLSVIEQQSDSTTLNNTAVTQPTEVVSTYFKMENLHDQY